eukprot:SAG31_NODE_2116_length_6414_cov_2.444181_4_plen_158_part_00
MPNGTPAPCPAPPQQLQVHAAAHTGSPTRSISSNILIWQVRERNIRGRSPGPAVDRVFRLRDLPAGVCDDGSMRLERRSWCPNGCASVRPQTARPGPQLPRLSGRISSLCRQLRVKCGGQPCEELRTQILRTMDVTRLQLEAENASLRATCAELVRR